MRQASREVILGELKGRGMHCSLEKDLRHGVAGRDMAPGAERAAGSTPHLRSQLSTLIAIPLLFLRSQILEIVQKIAPGRDGKDGADGDDGQTGPSVIVPSAPAPAPGPAGPVPDLLPELQRLLQELQVAVLDRVGGVERSLDRGLATSTSRLLAAIAGIGAGGGGAGGGGKAEVDLEPLRVQLLQMDEKVRGRSTVPVRACEGLQR